MSDAVIWLTIFVLAAFVGVEVISKVSSTLHTPLMSGANAIHGVILVGAILVAGHGRLDPHAGPSPGGGRAGRDQHGRWVRGHRPDAVMFSRRRPVAKEPSTRSWNGEPVWAQLALPARRGLLHRGAQGPVLTQDGPPGQSDRRRRRR